MIVSCRSKEKVFEINTVISNPVNTGKIKLKTTEQYISILYANLFQKALSANKLVEISECIQSIGDQEIAHEIIISNFLNDADIIIPTRAEMNINIDGFLQDTYHRFYVRDITESEKMYWKNIITANDSINPEMIYYAFALSNEYQYY
jgi:hypothetical protein